MFVFVVTVCLSLDANSCSSIIAKDTFLDEASCKEFAMKEYPTLLQSFPLVAGLQCLKAPGEEA